MSVGVPRPDPALCLAALGEAEREAVVSLAHTVGLPWIDCPPLRQLVVAVAVLRMTADLPTGLSELGRLREAAWALGAADDGAKLADAISRKLLRWQLKADAGGADKKSRRDAA